MSSGTRTYGWSNCEEAYRSRSVPFGALDGLRSPESAGAAHEDSSVDDDSPLGVPAPPLAPIPYLLERVSSQSEEPRRTAPFLFLGQPVRGRSANEGDPEGFWHELLEGFPGPTPQPFVIFIDDAALFDADGQELHRLVSPDAPGIAPSSSCWPGSYRPRLHRLGGGLPRTR